MPVIEALTTPRGRPRLRRRGAESHRRALVGDVDRRDGGSRRRTADLPVGHRCGFRNNRSWRSAGVGHDWRARSSPTDRDPVALPATMALAVLGAKIRVLPIQSSAGEVER
jgi:hypothetical protein